MVSSFITLICLLGLVNLLTCEPQGPPNSNLLDTIISRPNATGDVPQPPGERPQTDDNGPSPPGSNIGRIPDVPNPPFGQRLGDRCPFPPDQNGGWPDYCFDVIGDNCECYFDDIVVRQHECVTENITLYEELLHMQMRLERERDVRRHDLGLGSRPEAYQHVLDCLEEADRIILLFGGRIAPGKR